MAGAEPRERASEQVELAGLHYERGRARAAAGDPDGAISAFRDALRVQPEFIPAAVALGDAHLATGDAAQAVNVWERAAEAQPALPLLSRIERQWREEGRPTRMIALYQAAVARAPDNLAVALALGRVYFDLHMLDEAAEQLEKIEVRMPDLPVIHAYLGAVFERRGQVREALEDTAGRSAPCRASSGPTGARRAGPSTPAGPIGVRHVVAGTASGPSAATPVASGVVAVAHRRRRPRLPALLRRLRGRLGPGRRDPLCGGCWDGLERIGSRLRPVWAALRRVRRRRASGRRSGPKRRHLRRVPEPAARVHVCALGRPIRGSPARGPARVQVRRAPRARRAARRSHHRDGPRAGPGGAGPARPRAAAPAARTGAGLQPVLAPRPPAGGCWRVTARADVLTRRAATAPQTDLAADARRTNVGGAFESGARTWWPGVTSSSSTISSPPAPRPARAPGRSARPARPSWA